MSLIKQRPMWEKMLNKKMYDWIEKNHEHNVHLLFKDQSETAAAIVKKAMLNKLAVDTFSIDEREAEMGVAKGKKSTWTLLVEATGSEGAADSKLKERADWYAKKYFSKKNFFKWSGGQAGMGGVGHQIDVAKDMKGSETRHESKVSIKTMWHKIESTQTTEDASGLHFQFKKAELGSSVAGSKSRVKKDGTERIVPKDVFRSSIRSTMRRVCYWGTSPNTGSILDDLFDFIIAHNKTTYIAFNDLEMAKKKLQAATAKKAKGDMHHQAPTTYAAIQFAREYDGLMKTLIESMPSRWEERIHTFGADIAADIDLFKTTLDSAGRGRKTQLKDNLTVEIKVNTKNPIEPTDKPGVQKTINAFFGKLVIELVKEYANDPKKLVEMQGSKSLKQRAVKIGATEMIMNMFPHKSRPDMRYRVNKLFAKQFVEQQKQQSKGKKKGGKTRRSVTRVSHGKRNTAGSGRAAAASGKLQSMQEASPVKLRNLLNATLPMEVAGRMVAPKLQFRTGRFASSARVNKISKGPKGGTYVDYTYMRNPYGTFEPGGKMGDVHRDPRKIIEASIRAIAAKQMGGKFTGLRRV